MCWACYTPLPSSHLKPVQGTRDPRSRCIEYVTVAASISGVILALASGWLPRPYRVKALVAGVSLLGFGDRLDPLLAALNRYRHRNDPPVPTPDPWDFSSPDLDAGDQEPIVRITSTIALYAFREGAQEIRILAGRKGCQVIYKVGEEWREQMKIPLYIWEPLKQHITSSARETPAEAPRKVIPVKYQDCVYNLEVTVDQKALVENLSLLVQPTS